MHLLSRLRGLRSGAPTQARPLLHLLLLWLGSLSTDAARRIAPHGAPLRISDSLTPRAPH